MDDSLDPHIQHVLGWNASETLWNTSVKHESMGQNSNHIITWFSPCPGRFRSNFKSKNKRRKQKQYTPRKLRCPLGFAATWGAFQKQSITITIISSYMGQFHPNFVHVMSWSHGFGGVDGGSNPYNMNEFEWIVDVYIYIYIHRNHSSIHKNPSTSKQAIQNVNKSWKNRSLDEAPSRKLQGFCWKFTPRSLTARPWKTMVGRRSFPIGFW